MKISNIDTFGVKVYLYYAIDDAPRTLAEDTFEEGANLREVELEIKIPGYHTIHGLSLNFCLHSLFTDISDSNRQE